MIRPLLITLAAASLAACETQQRVISVRGPLRGLPGAVAQEPTDDQPQIGDIGVTLDKADPVGAKLPGEPIEGFPLRRRLDDGSILLISRAPRHVLQHLVETLQAEEDDLLFNQVLSRRLKQNYIDRGMDPRAAVTQLKRDTRQIIKLANAMPLGEATPGATMHTIGRNMFEVTAPGAEMLDQVYTRLQTTLEDGSFRLLLVR